MSAQDTHGLELGVRTAAGTTSSFEVPTAKGFSVLGAEDADVNGRDELFVQMTTVHRRTLGVGVFAAVFVDCELRPVENVDGDLYMFLLGEWGRGALRGMGCVEVDGRRRLVGLEGRRRGDRAAWSRTVVELHGQARNGPMEQGSFRQGRDDWPLRRWVKRHAATTNSMPDSAPEHSCPGP